jgi:hypothetical protein
VFWGGEARNEKRLTVGAQRLNLKPLEKVVKSFTIEVWRRLLRTTRVLKGC